MEEKLTSNWFSNRLSYSHSNEMETQEKFVQENNIQQKTYHLSYKKIGS